MIKVYNFSEFEIFNVKKIWIKTLTIKDILKYSFEIIKEYESKVLIRDRQINKSKIVEIKELFEDYIITICF
ncbi:hypothetical protein [Clostridium kluyveri]|uniref:hypothetical protein n=1 Tax=Clostridium kluyveri TaxID=1534 RepID=UPI000325CD45|nr:hypothetical protein [Clostridium kluyveri]